jgi:membrane-associated phospholipid phosphatase
MCMRIKIQIIAALVIAAMASDAMAATTTPPVVLTKTEKNIETLGTGVAIALPLVAGGIAISKGDRTGIVELTVETALTVGTAYALKNIVRERRPDGSDYHSFPSETTALAASGSSFLWGRYGWDYGLPALVATEFVSYSRVQAKQHRWYDTLASSGIAAGCGYFVTSRFYKWSNVYTSLEATPDSGMIRVSYEF